MEVSPSRVSMSTDAVVQVLVHVALSKRGGHAEGLPVSGLLESFCQLFSDVPRATAGTVLQMEPSSGARLSALH